MCSKLKEGEAMELRSDINALLRNSKAPKPLSMEERIGSAQLKKGKGRVIHTADKGLAMVVMNKKEYSQWTHQQNQGPAHYNT